MHLIGYLLMIGIYLYLSHICKILSKLLAIFRQTEAVKRNQGYIF